MIGRDMLILGTKVRKIKQLFMNPEPPGKGTKKQTAG